MPAPERTLLRATFDSVAADYDRLRPTYPERLFDALVDAARLAPGDRVLEIGPGPGTATRSLAARGLRITGLELGPELAAAARRNLANLAEVEIVQGDFDTWEPPAGGPFDLVAAATAWHWPDPDTRYDRAAAALRPGGHLAFWSARHVVTDDSDPFFTEIQEVYEAIGAALPDQHSSFPGRLEDSRAEIERSGRFTPILIRHFTWELDYDAESYIALIGTFSSHIVMTPEQRETLYAAIRQRLARRSGGRLRRDWGAVLHVARRREG